MGAYVYLYKNNGTYTWSADVSLDNARNVWIDDVSQEILDNLSDENRHSNYIYENEKLRKLTEKEKLEMFPSKVQEKTEVEKQLDRMEEKMVQIENSVGSINTYKQAYDELTDGSGIDPLVMRERIQALMVSADSTSVVNAEAFVDTWQSGTMNDPIEYTKDISIRKHKGQVYECCQSHTHHGEPGYEPDVFKAGWRIKHTKDVTNPKPYIQPQGAHDSYMKDECVTWEGKVYVSVADNNVYSPTDYPQNWRVNE